MHKAIITSIFVIIATLSAWGQSDRYCDISETPGQIIQMYNMDELFNQHKAFVYIKNETGKLIKVKDPQYYTELHSKQLKVLRIENIKKNTYWVLNYHGKELYLLMGKIDYCKSILSVSYWQQEYAKIFNSYSHYISHGASPDELNSYKPITWVGFHMPQTMSGAPTMGYKVEGATAALITPSEITSENGFRTNDEYTQIKKDIEERIRLEKLEQERKDSIADHTHVIQVRIARKPITFESFKQNGVFEDAPRFSHLNLDVFMYSKPSKYTTYSVEKAWDYYLTIYHYDSYTREYIGYCKGKVLALPKEALANVISVEDEQYLLRRNAKGLDVRKRVASEYDNDFYASSKHLDNIAHLKPDNKSTATNDIIGRKYIVQKEYFYFQNDPLRIIATNEALKDNVSRKEIFTCVDVIKEDNTLSTSYNIAIFENPKYGYCWIDSHYIDSYLDEYDKVIRNQQKRKEWEKKMLEKYGEINGKTIIEGKVRVGFTAEMCRDSWGKPSDINRTTTAYGVHEQWVYGYGNYLYFEDGILTTIQN